MATSPFNYDPELLQSNTSSRAAAHPDLDPELVDKVIAMPVHKIMELCEIARRDFQQIHENIRTFYRINRGISTSQKATMATFLIQHPELMGETPMVAEPAPVTRTGLNVVAPTQYEDVHIAATEESMNEFTIPRSAKFAGMDTEIDEETGARIL